MFSKRGETESNIELWFLIAAFLLAAFAGVNLIDNIKDEIEGTTLVRNFIARDLALTLDAVYTSPGDVTYIYNMKKNNFPVKVVEGRVEVRKDNIEDSNPTVYRIFGSGRKKLNFDADTELCPEMENDCQICLEIKKEQGEVSISSMKCKMTAGG